MIRKQHASKAGKTTSSVLREAENVWKSSSGDPQRLKRKMEPSSDRTFQKKIYLYSLEVLVMIPYKLLS